MNKDAKIKFWNYFERKAEGRMPSEFALVRIHDNGTSNNAYYELKLTDLFYKVVGQNPGITVGLSIAEISEANGEYPAIHVTFVSGDNRWQRRLDFERKPIIKGLHVMADRDNLGTGNKTFRTVIYNPDIQLPNYFEEGNPRIEEAINWFIEILDTKLIPAFGETKNIL